MAKWQGSAQKTGSSVLLHLECGTATFDMQASGADALRIADSIYQAVGKTSASKQAAPKRAKNASRTTGARA